MNAKNPEEFNTESNSFPANRLPSLFPESLLCDVMGGPHDGLVCCRTLGGMLVGDVNITRLANGFLLVGNMLMPGGLILYSVEKAYTYLRYYNEYSGESKYVWEGLEV